MSASYKSFDLRASLPLFFSLSANLRCLSVSFSIMNSNDTTLLKYLILGGVLNLLGPLSDVCLDFLLELGIHIFVEF